MKKRIWTVCLCLLMLGALFVLPPVLQAATVTWAPTSVLTAGEQYMFIASGMKDCSNTTYDECVVKSVMSADPHGLAYGNKPSGTVPSDCLWTLESAGGTSYYLRSEANGKYLNIVSGAGGKGKATLAASKQALTLTMDGARVKISATLGGEVYYVRFTNTYAPNSCWEAGTATSSNSFAVYAKGGAKAEYNNTTKPLFSVACFADLHVDYGIQTEDTPIRPGTIGAANFVRNTIGAADVVLVGGDITSNNASGTNRWNTNIINKTRDTVYNTLAAASKDGKVMFITGNHDNEAGTVSSDGDVIYSGDYDKYMTNHIGNFTAQLRFNDMKKGTSKYNELLCYRYTVGGMEFIGINTPYRTARSSGYIYLEQIDWVEQQLAAIGKEKTVIIFCHYPLENTDLGILNAPGQSGANAKMEAVLKKYPNTLYCYGHVHGDDYKYAWYNTSELVVPQGPVTKTASNAYTTNSYIRVHMGSMGYYNNKFQPGGLAKAEPMINQLLMIDFYSDHITFRYYNTGAKSAVDGVYEISSFTVMRDMSSQLGSSTGGTTGGSTGGTTGSTGNGSSGGTTGGSGSSVPSGGSSGSLNPSTNPGTDPGTNLPDGSLTNTDSVVSSGTTDKTAGGILSGTTDGNASVSGSVSDKNSDQSTDEESDSLPKWVLPTAIVVGILILAGGGFALWRFVILPKKRGSAEALSDIGERTYEE